MPDTFVYGGIEFRADEVAAVGENPHANMDLGASWLLPKGTRADSAAFVSGAPGEAEALLGVLPATRHFHTARDSEAWIAESEIPDGRPAGSSVIGGYARVDLLSGGHLTVLMGRSTIFD